MTNIKYNIGFIGAGNVAYHLAAALKEQGHRIRQIISRPSDNLVFLADSVGAMANEDISDLQSGLDVVFLTVPDNVIPEIVEQVKGFKGVLAHTCGSVPMEVFEGIGTPYGVLYPLQTFTWGREIEFRTIPIFVEGSDEKALGLIKELSSQISEGVYDLESDKRALLHLAAVFTNNFTNFLLTASNELLSANGVEKEVMHSLIRETMEKSLELGPENAQTGPALRGDFSTIKKHLKLLSCYPELNDIYQCLTGSIQKYYSTGTGKK